MISQTDLRLLLVEDNPTDARLVLHELRQAGFNVTVTRVETEAAFAAALDDEPEVILCDFSLPQFEALQALAIARERHPEIPFLIVSGSIGEETAVEAIKLGATDYLLKDRLGRLGRAVRQALEQRELRDARRKLEEQFLQAQKMEAFGQLAGGVAHDFNNHLTVINGYAEVFMDEFGPDDPRRAWATAIRDSGERAARLTQQLLAFSRKAIIEPVVLCLNDTVESMSHMLRRLIGEDITLTTTLAPQLNRVKIDPSQVEQVLLNLAVNARDAMPTGGRLTIETGNIEIFRSPREDVAPGHYARLTVSDTGTGMTPEVIAKIFEPFFTTKPLGQGTGLGLATVYGIVTQSQGHIEVESHVGRGTTFQLMLPIIAEPAAPVPTTALAAPERGSETVLLVEDEELVRKLTSMALEVHGYGVLQAASGAEALRLAEFHEGPIHLLVTDVVMPLMSGRIVAEKLLKLRPEMSVLYVSGYTDDAVVRHGVIQATDNFLQKPFTPLGLARKVRSLLDIR